MTHVVFALPYALDTTLRFVRSVAKLPGVELGIVTQEDPARFPQDLRDAVVSFQPVDDALDADSLEASVRQCGRELGGVDRLIGILEPMQESMAAVRERLGVPGMSLATARNFRDKSKMKDVLRENDIPCARHGLATTRDEAIAFGESSGYPIVVKPPDGAGAKNTFRVNDAAEMEQCLQMAPPRDGQPVLLEEFVQGREHSFDSVSIGGRHLFHSISRYTPTPLEVMQTPWIQWCVSLPRSIDGPEFEDILAVGPRVLDVLGMETGLTHMEWFRRPDGSLAISEVAARPPGAQFTSLISWAHDIDLYSAWAEVVIFDRFEVPERRWAVGAAFLRGQGRGRVRSVRGVEEAQKALGELVVEARLPQVGQPAATSYEGEGYVILRHTDTEVVERGLQKLVKTLQVNLT